MYNDGTQFQSCFNLLLYCLIITGFVEANLHNQEFHVRVNDLPMQIS